MNNQLFDLIFKINGCVEKENKKDLYRKQLRIAGFSEGFGEDTFLQTFENLDFLCLDESQAKKIKVEVYVDLKKEETTYTVYGFGAEINFVCKIGDELLNLNIDECPLKTKYRYYKHNNEDMLQVEWDKRTKNKTFFYPDAKNKQKVVIIGNSFTENFVSFLAYTFSHVKKYRSNNQDANNLVLSRWKEEILKFQPDIMLIVIQSESSSKLIDLKD